MAPGPNMLGICNPSVAACPVVNPIYYTGGAVPPVADTYQPVIVPAALVDDPTRPPNFDFPIFYDFSGTQSPNVAVYFSDPQKASEDMLADGSTLLQKEAEDERAYLAKFTPGKQVLLSSLYDDMPPSLRPPEKYRYGYSISVEDVQDGGRVILLRPNRASHAFPDAIDPADTVNAVPIQTWGTTPMFAAFDSADLLPSDNQGNGTTLVASGCNTNPFSNNHSFDFNGRAMVAGGFVTTGTGDPMEAFKTVGPMVGAYYASDWEAGHLMNFAGMPQDYQRAFRPILTPALTAGNYWAFTEIGSRIQARFPSLPGTAPANWVQFKQAVPGMLVVSHLSGQLANMTGIDSLKNGTFGNTLVRIGVPAMVYRYGPMLAARFPLIAGALKLAPLKIAGSALAMVTAVDFGASIGDSLRVAIRCRSDECQLTEALFNAVYGEDINDSWFPGIKRKWVQLESHWSSSYETKMDKMFSSWLQVAGQDFPKAVDSLLMDAAVHAMTMEGGKYTFHWDVFEQDVRQYYGSNDFSGVYDLIDLIAEKAEPWAVDGISGGTKLKNLISKDGAVVDRAGMQDYLNVLFRRKSLDDLVAAKQAGYYDRYVSLGLGVGVSLKQVPTGVGVTLKTPFGERYVPLMPGDEITFGDPNSFIRKGELGDLGIRTRYRDDGVVEITMETKNGPVRTKILAAWNDQEKNYTMIEKTEDGQGRPLTADTVTHTGHLMMTVPVPRDQMTRAQMEFLRGSTQADGTVSPPEAAVWKNQIESLLAFQQAVDHGTWMKDLVDFSR